MLALSIICEVDQLLDLGYKRVVVKLLMYNSKQLDATCRVSALDALIVFFWISAQVIPSFSVSFLSRSNYPR